MMTRALSLVIVLFLVSLLPANAQDPRPCRPLVFVPGILGTELLDQQNNVVWGGAGSLWNFAQLEIAENGPVTPLHPGRPISAVNVLGPFWSVHQYDSLFDTLGSIGYREGINLFIFGYDWRLSNLDNADALRRFIDNEPMLKGKEFDIVAHSMGGIIASIYVQQLPDPSNVKRVIGLGVPARGSMNALAEMTEGWGGFENFLAGGVDTIRRVMFSFPALFELFPSYENCCRLGVPTPQGFKPFDPTEMDLWRAGDWIPPEHRTPGGLARVQAAMGNARKVRSMMRQPLPPNVEQMIIAGNLLGTKLYLYVDPQNQSWRNWHFSTSVGDGTVPIWSAAGTAGVGRTLPTFADHATIFNDRWVVNLLSRTLNCNSALPPVAGTNLALAQTKSNRLVEIASIDPDFDRVVVRAGDTVHFTMRITVVDAVAREELSPKVTLMASRGVENLVMHDDSTPQDVAARTLKFSAEIKTSDAGAYSVQMTFEGMMGAYTRDIIALE